jgi:DNA-binding MarR family transcriptional regulator
MSNNMIRDSNQSERWWQPTWSPSGTDNFANLLRDPSLAATELVARRLAAAGHADLRPALLAVGQHVRQDGSRIPELPDRAHLTKPTVGHAVDELARLGYVERVPDPRDGRAKLVVMTARARDAERVARAAIADLRAAWAEAMAPGELDELEALLRRLRAVLWPEA